MKKYVEKYKAEKRESFNIVIFSVVLSTIINIISGALCELYDVPPMIYIISGSAITIALIIGSLFYKINELNETVTYKGMFIVDRENKNSFFISFYNIKLITFLLRFQSVSNCGLSYCKFIIYTGYS